MMRVANGAESFLIPELMKPDNINRIREEKNAIAMIMISGVRMETRTPLVFDVYLFGVIYLKKV